MRETLDDADARLLAEITFDRSFVDFAAHCEQAGIPLTVLSSGIEPLIRRMLARHGLPHLPVIANAVEVQAEGWRIHFRDDGPNGTDKAGIVAAAKAARSEYGLHRRRPFRFRGGALRRRSIRQARARARTLPRERSARVHAVRTVLRSPDRDRGGAALKAPTRARDAFAGRPSRRAATRASRLPPPR